MYNDTDNISMTDGFLAGAFWAFVFLSGVLFHMWWSNSSCTDINTGINDSIVRQESKR